MFYDAEAMKKRKELTKNGEIRAFFEAIMKAEPEAGETLFNPVAYSSFRSLEALVQDQIHRELSEERWFQELKPEAQRLVRIAVGLSVNALQETYKKTMEMKWMRGKNE